jgi:hypothetical protein
MHRIWRRSLQLKSLVLESVIRLAANKILRLNTDWHRSYSTSGSLQRSRESCAEFSRDNLLSGVT